MIIGEDARWTLPPADQIAKMRRKALRELIHAYIEHAERGDAQNRRGGVELAIVRAQYLRYELARRSLKLGQPVLLSNSSFDSIVLRAE